MKIVTGKKELTDYLGLDYKDLLFKLYDGLVRVVDPVTNKIELMTEQGGMQANENLTCYDIWNKKNICANCTSLRALLRNEPISKIETKDNLVYLVHSLPFSLKNGRKVVLEVIKNLTNVTIKTDIYSYSDPDFITLLRTVDRLNEQVYRDTLTNAFNREYLTAKLSGIISRGNCTVLMLDIDNFKKINDMYGHPVGDVVLQNCVGVLSSKLREQDVVIRYGGDEFIVLLDFIDQDEAINIVARLNETFLSNSVQLDHKDIRYEVSIGSFTVTQADLELSEIIKKADESMYEVKRKKQENMFSVRYFSN